MNNQPELQILKPEKGPSMYDLVLGIQDGGSGVFAISDANYIRNIISGKVKYSHPGRKFKTEKSGEILLVHRSDKGFDDGDN